MTNDDWGGEGVLGMMTSLMNNKKPHIYFKTEKIGLFLPEITRNLLKFLMKKSSPV